MALDIPPAIAAKELAQQQELKKIQEKARKETRAKRNQHSKLRSKVIMTPEFRKKLRDGEFSYYLMPLSFAISKDTILDILNFVLDKAGASTGDLLSYIPIIGTFVGTAFKIAASLPGLAIGLSITLPISIFLLISLWGKGSFKVKLMYRLLILSGLLPFISLLPIETFAVLFVYSKCKEERRLAQEKLKKAGQLT